MARAALFAAAFAPALAFGDGTAMNRPKWQDLAGELNSPDVVLGLAADMGVIFANHFWVMLEDAWIAISLLAVLAGAVGYAGGFFRGREMIVQRMFWVMVVITLGMQPMPHSSYTAENGNNNAQVFSKSAVGSEDNGEIGYSGSTAPILIEIPTRIFMGFHTLFGSAVYNTFGSGYLDSKQGVAFSAINALNDNTPARVLANADGDLANIWRVYQTSCRQLALDPAYQRYFSGGSSRLLGFDGAGMLINPAATSETLGESGISEEAQRVMKDHVPYIYPRFEEAQERLTTGEPIQSESGGGVHPEVYATYRIPSAHYWMGNLSGDPDIATDGPRFLTPPGADDVSADPNLSHTRFSTASSGGTPNDLFAGIDPTSMTDNQMDQYWIPKNCWEYYQVTQMGFNHYYAGYGSALASNSRDDEQACVADGLKTILSRNEGSTSGVSSQGPLPITANQADEERAYKIMEQWFPESECDYEGRNRVSSSFRDPLEGAQTSAGTVSNVSSGMIAKVQNSLRANNDGTTPHGFGKDYAFDVADTFNMISETIGGLSKYLNLSRNVPLIKGFLGLAYAITIMVFPFIVAFAVIPGRSDLLFLPLKLMLYCHVSMFLLYFVFQVAGWASAALVAILINTENTKTMMTGPFSDLLAALPLLVHFIVGVVLWLSWKLIFGGFERGVGGSEAMRASTTAQQQGQNTVQTVAGGVSSANRGAGAGMQAASGGGKTGAAGLAISGIARGWGKTAEATEGNAGSGSEHGGRSGNPVAGDGSSASQGGGNARSGGSGGQGTSEGAQRHAGSQSPSKKGYSHSSLRAQTGKGRTD